MPLIRSYTLLSPYFFNFLTPKERSMPKCPKCGSDNVKPLPILSIIGAFAGIATGALDGARAGYAIFKTPDSRIVGTVVGLIIGSHVGGVLGFLLGVIADLTLLKRYKCPDCDYTFND